MADMQHSDLTTVEREIVEERYAAARKWHDRFYALRDDELPPAQERLAAAQEEVDRLKLLMHLSSVEMNKSRADRDRDTIRNAVRAESEAIKTSAAMRGLPLS